MKHQRPLPQCSLPLHRGFTLMEVMITTVIVAILTAIAYPSYVNYLLRSHRIDAKVALTSAVQNLERYYTERNTYTGATVGSSGIYPTSSPNGFYTISLTLDPVRSAVLPVGTTFLLQAVPQGSQAADSQCGTYTLDETGFKTAAGVSDAATLAKCW